jgi:hypothetical protein
MPRVFLLIAMDAAQVAQVGDVPLQNVASLWRRHQPQLEPPQLEQLEQEEQLEQLEPEELEESLRPMGSKLGVI